MESQRFDGKRHSATVFNCREVILNSTRRMVLVRVSSISIDNNIVSHMRCRCRMTDASLPQCGPHSRFTNRDSRIIRGNGHRIRINHFRPANGRLLSNILPIAKVPAGKFGIRRQFRVKRPRKYRRSKTDVNPQLTAHEHDPPAKRQTRNCYVSLAHFRPTKFIHPLLTIDYHRRTVNMASFCVFGRISKLRSLNRIIAGKKW